MKIFNSILHSSLSLKTYYRYVKDSLLNTNPIFDYSAFRNLAAMAATTMVVSTFAFTFTTAGLCSYACISIYSLCYLFMYPPIGLRSIHFPIFIICCLLVFHLLQFLFLYIFPSIFSCLTFLACLFFLFLSSHCFILLILYHYNFIFVFIFPGTYVFTMSDDSTVPTIITVMAANVQCGTTAQFSTNSQASLIALGVVSNSSIVLSPDWPLVIGLLVGMSSEILLSIYCAVTLHMRG